MNSGKSLGQVAFEAFYPEGDFERTASGGFAADGWVKDWERAGRAVYNAILLQRAAADSKAIDERLAEARIEGAKEERERIFVALERYDCMAVAFLKDALAGGKP